MQHRSPFKKWIKSCKVFTATRKSPLNIMLWSDIQKRKSLKKRPKSLNSITMVQAQTCFSLAVLATEKKCYTVLLLYTAIHATFG